MSYEYGKEKPYIFTEAGQRDFLKVRDHANSLARISGALTVEHAMEPISGDSWKMLACVDRLVELGEFRYVFEDTATHNRVLIKVHR